MSRSIVAFSALAVFLLLISGPGTRFGIWNFRVGILLVQLAAGTSLLALILGIVAAVSARKNGGSFPPAPFAAMIVALGLLGFLGSIAKTAKSLPMIHDITTDTENPPLFQAVLPLRAGAMNPPEYLGGEIIAQQKQAYPDIQAKTIAAEPRQAFDRAIAQVRQLGWEVVEAKPELGRIEATETTAFFGFKDDITIRLTPEGTRGTRIDMRSKSRVGLTDLGANAKRIRKFLASIQ